MSIWHKEIIRLDGTLYAFVKIQDDYTGAIKRDIRDIHIEGNNYYIVADGGHVNVNEAREQFLQYEDRVRTALDWYRKTKF